MASGLIVNVIRRKQHLEIASFLISRERIDFERVIGPPLRRHACNVDRETVSYPERGVTDEADLGAGSRG